LKVNTKFWKHPCNKEFASKLVMMIKFKLILKNHESTGKWESVTAKTYSVLPSMSQGARNAAFGCNSSMLRWRHEPSAVKHEMQSDKSNSESCLGK